MLEHRAAAFIYLVAPGDVISDTTLNIWAHEVVPAVREAIASSERSLPDLSVMNRENERSRSRQRSSLPRTYAWWL